MAKVKVKVSHSCLTLCDPHGLYSPWNSPGQKTGVGSLFLLQRIFPIQGLNPGLPPCTQILYLLSHKGSAEMAKERYMYKDIFFSLEGLPRWH